MGREERSGDTENGRERRTKQKQEREKAVDRD